MRFKTIDFLTYLRQHLMENPTLGPQISGVFLQTIPDLPYPYITLTWHKTSRTVDRGVIHFSLKLWSVSKGIQEMEDLSIALQEILQDSSFARRNEFPYPFSLKQISQETTHDPQGVRCCHMTYQAFVKHLTKDFVYAA
jgi:hypothetical protein